MGRHFDATNGPPNKQIDSLLGLASFIDFHGWAAQIADEDYKFRLVVFYAPRCDS
jgi:hypothetical protein